MINVPHSVSERTAGHSLFPRCQQVERGKPWSGYRIPVCVCIIAICVTPPFSCFFVFSSRCTRKEKCERSSEPRRFASNINQCVRLSVHPNNISVSQFSVTVSGNTLLARANMTTVTPSLHPPLLKALRKISY